MDKIHKEYNSTRDYILLNMFNYDGFRSNGKIVAKGYLNKTKSF